MREPQVISLALKLRLQTGGAMPEHDRRTLCALEHCRLQQGKPQRGHL